MSPEGISGVADTAFLLAAFRAQESARPDALFSDPLAARLAGERGQAMLAAVSHLGEVAGWSSIVRTVLIDRLLIEALVRGVRTVLDLGAGLDTRPYRMAFPASLRWLEVDLPPVIAWKAERLQDERPRCGLERIALDLLDGPARREWLARACPSDEPALVLAEGVLPYLEEADVGALASDLRAHPAIGGLIVDYLSPALVQARQAMARMRLHDLPLRFAPDDWQGFFAAHGWRVAEVRDLAREGVRCGRPFPVPEAARALVQAGPPLLPEAAGGSSTFAAYALLEPA